MLAEVHVDSHDTNHDGTKSLLLAGTAGLLSTLPTTLESDFPFSDNSVDLPQTISNADARDIPATFVDAIESSNGLLLHSSSLL